MPEASAGLTDVGASGGIGAKFWDNGLSIVVVASKREEGQAARPSDQLRHFSLQIWDNVRKN
ncbi:hypothetical protein [Jannaschia sp. M317]|uniref:hypothetical protein n=1 Tax=Jannaschia sp. M317 TaxID=2867011 RepID=UPI0021A3B879|nr:hypothetical protein [Jannaschia sp. M317]UWQ19093.1 hypothetical protein K3551_07425 [Jannaschia sp. M317]